MMPSVFLPPKKNLPEIKSTGHPQPPPLNTFSLAKQNGDRARPRAHQFAPPRTGIETGPAKGC